MAIATDPTTEYGHDDASDPVLPAAKRKPSSTLTTISLSKVDPATLDGDDLKEYAQAAADRLNLT